LVLPCACSGEDAPSGFSSRDYLKVEGDVILGAQETTRAFSIDANCHWSIAGSNSWEGLAISPTEGDGSQSIAVSTGQNHTVSSRMATFTIKTNDGITKQVTIQQTAGSAELTLSENEYIFEPDGGNWTLSVMCNTSWVVSGSADGFSYLPLEGQGNGTVDITVGENPLSSVRTLVLTIVADNERQTVTISQKAKILLSTNTNTIEADAYAGEYQLDIYGNYAWTATTDDPWIALGAGSGLGDGTLSVSLTANDTGQQRVGTVTITSGKVIQAISVVQAIAGTAEVTGTSVTDVGTNGATVSAQYRSVYPVTEYGVCYATSSKPTINDQRMAMSGTSVSGNIEMTLSGIASGKTYYVRPYAVNAAGIAYGDEQRFTTTVVKPGADDNHEPDLVKSESY